MSYAKQSSVTNHFQVVRMKPIKTTYIQCIVILFNISQITWLGLKIPFINGSVDVFMDNFST